MIAPSFGDIFASNAANNGLLAAQVSEDEAEHLLAGTGPLRIDLQTYEIAGDGHLMRFAIDPVHRTKLLNGWNDMDLTLSFADRICAFAQGDAVARPWLVPAERG